MVTGLMTMFSNTMSKNYGVGQRAFAPMINRAAGFQPFHSTSLVRRAD